ncbi:MAG: type II toxin-antitoxin system VapC family toxin [Ruminococcaceae bacterium]|jgi:PIN domain nuclease of toxin-antitoxin system|nr:type II toxin-antitoxin system VapC family toxin [Oscillospiraceae bacterium]
MYLLDTHTFLWFLNDDPKLPHDTKELIETAAEPISVSIGTFWEMAIKDSIGKLELPAPITQLMEDCREMGFTILPIQPSHLERLKQLPKLHGDPFDRLYICAGFFSLLSRSTPRTAGRTSCRPRA